MPKTLEYAVYSAVVEQVQVTTTYRDKPITAWVNGLTVELVGVGEGNNHAHTFRFVPEHDDDLKAHQDMFQQGRRIRVAFDAVENGDQQ